MAADVAFYLDEDLLLEFSVTVEMLLSSEFKVSPGTLEGKSTAAVCMTDYETAIG